MQCLTCGMMNIDPLSHTHTKETQSMSDTLQEREDQMDQHQVNKSGTCVIPGCPCRGWSAQETAVVAKEEKSEMSTKSACVLTGAATESAEDCSTHRHRIESHQPAARGGGDETPERIWLTRKYGDRIWKPKAGVEAELQEYIRMDQHQSLVAERDELRRVMRIIRDSYWSENEPYSERVEYLQEMAKAALQQRSTSA